ncbi:11K virion structural protein [Carcinus maenas nudivirus]|uniref:11K virion structural protein n=1 Tax=Carcinus maenas nudivirus TaxID=2880837 RepID=A0AAE9BYX4_9VIRU|nr:11K virion structural protein [Carcinus maenas nudivirus]UBZ25679.1 11K virion structural protein [Carcinus maenas nudivirus]
MNRARELIQPVCNDISKALQLSGGIEVIIIIIIFIMLVFAASYNNMYTPTLTEDVTKKADYINGLIIASAVLSTILMAVGIWHLYTSGKAKKCIQKTIA